MKGLKLNAVVASMLSLGIICSGSVFASGVQPKGEIEVASKVKKKPLRKKAIDKRRNQNKKLKIMLDQKLGEFYQLSIGWPDNLKELYNGIGWKKAQIDVDCFVEKILENDSDLLKIIKRMRDFSEDQGLSEECGIMKNVVYICCRLKENFEKISNYSAEVR